MYTLKYYYLGEEYVEDIDASLVGNLVEAVEDLVFSNTSDPDTVFTVVDKQGNILFTEENIK